MENIEVCTKAKSVLNVLGPIANQVVELRGKHGTVCDATAVMKLLKQCQSVKNACELLVSRLSSYANSQRDQLLSSEIQNVRNRLDKVIESLTDFTRDLHRGDAGVRENDEVWSDIIENSENLLTVLTEALLAWDRAQVRKIAKSIAVVQEQLSRLQQVHFVQHLPEDFQEVVSACGNLLSLIQHRCEDLYRRAQSETLQLLALQLCHTLPLLASTCTATVSHPLSKQVKASRELVLKRIQTLLQDIEYQAGQGSDNYDLEEAGTFISCVDKTLDLLMREEKFNDSSDMHQVPLSEEVKSLLEEVLRHGVAVAYCSCPDDNRAIMSMCENVLKQLKHLVGIERLESHDDVDFNLAKDMLADSIEALEQKVNTALIRQIVKTFAVPLAPLEALLKALEPNQEVTSTKALEDLIANFDIHVDHIFQVGGFAAACTSDNLRVRHIRNSLLTLEWLETCLIPSIINAHNDHHVHAKAHAHMLAKHWSMAVELLCNTLDEIMDPSAFSLVTKQEVHQSWALLKEQLYTQDMSWIKKHVENVISLSSRILALHRLDSFLTDRQEDDIQMAISEMKKSLGLVLDSPKDLSRHRSLIKRVQLTLTLMSRLSSSLNEENLQFLEEYSYADTKRVTKKPLPARLSETDKHQLITSNIEDIPVDVATPFTGRSAPRTSKEPLDEENRCERPKNQLKSMKSASKLGEGRYKLTNTNLTMQGHHSKSMQAITSDTLGLDSTSIDITKFLSRSTNTLSSARSSKRNFSLKVKEINLDISAALKRPDLPPLPTQPDKRRLHLEGQLEDSGSCDESSLVEVSELIAQEKSPVTSQQSIGNELSGILEDLTSLAGDLTALVTPSTQKRKCPWQDFSYGDKENQSYSSLHGIKIQNVSFNPKFPEIKSTDTSGVIFENEEPRTSENAGEESSSSISEKSLGECADPTVWKDFTAILETKTPAKNNLFDFTSNFNNWHNWQPSGMQISFTSFGKGKNVRGIASPANNQISKIADLSDTPFLVKSASQTSLPETDRTTEQLTANYSVSPSSATFGTPQRLKDIQLVQERLRALKENMT
ncbi:vinculin-like [Palaemon carinicauda]|uniref:vinculin-like n=1 Tax=Palaemon carinicauda TaxID=392227 RepID=UPI0035B6A681